MLTKCGGKKVAGKSARGQMKAAKWERMAADDDHDRQVAAMVLVSREGMQTLKELFGGVDNALRKQRGRLRNSLQHTKGRSSGTS